MPHRRLHGVGITKKTGLKPVSSLRRSTLQVLDISTLRSTIEVRRHTEKTPPRTGRISFFSRHLPARPLRWSRHGEPPLADDSDHNINLTLRTREFKKNRRIFAIFQDFSQSSAGHKMKNVSVAAALRSVTERPTRSDACGKPRSRSRRCGILPTGLGSAPFADPRFPIAIVRPQGGKMNEKKRKPAAGMSAYNEGKGMTHAS